MNSLRQHAAALYDTARCLTLCRIAELGNTITAWAETRDLDTDWHDFHEVRQ